MPTTSKTTAAEREQKVLATKIAKLRADGLPYDGENGICQMQGMPKTATKCRDLLRTHSLVAKAGGIAKSYDRTDAFRAEESARRKARAEAASKPEPKKRAPKAAAKATPRKRAASKA